jgi:hypothetical protein
MVVLLATCATQPPPAPPQPDPLSSARPVEASVSRPPRPEIDPDLCRTTGIEFADPIHEIGCADCWGVLLRRSVSDFDPGRRVATPLQHGRPLPARHPLHARRRCGASRRSADLIDAASADLHFVVHAPRQVGKTTTLMSLAAELTREGRYTALLVSMEVGAPFRSDPGAAELAVLGSWRMQRRAWLLPPELQPPPGPTPHLASASRPRCGPGPARLVPPARPLPRRDRRPPGRGADLRPAPAA